MTATARELWDQLTTRLIFPLERRPGPPGEEDAATFLDRLIQEGWLTEFQREEILAGRLERLRVGNYRLSNELEHGPQGRVFVAEHLLLRQVVVVRLATWGQSLQGPVASRWLNQVASVARWNHPAIVGVIDAGVCDAQNEGEGGQGLYFVCPRVEGLNLRQLVQREGPLPLELACEILYAVAHAMAEAHARNFINGFLSPTSVARTTDGKVRLVDFGLKAWPRELYAGGSAEEPEQEASQEPGTKHADLLGMAQCIYWALMGSELPTRGNELLTAAPMRSLRPDVPPALEEMVQRLLDPATRMEWTFVRIQEGLLPFVAASAAASTDSLGERAYPPTLVVAPPPPPARTLAPLLPPEKASRSVLIVDDEPSIRSFCRLALSRYGLTCDEAANGVLALKAASNHSYDLILLDIDMPEMDGLETCRRLRKIPNRPHLKIVLFSGRVTGDEMAPMLLTGADDFLTKPFSPIQLQNRVQAALRFKQTQERTDLLTRELLLLNRQMEDHLHARDSDLVDARNALVLGLAKLAEYRDDDTGRHLSRVQRFCTRLAEEVLRHPSFAGQIDRNFIDLLACCAPLHDIGKVGLPDHILLKPTKLDEEERRLMQTHTTIGAETLRSIADEHGFARAFLRMAIDITRHHHERFDGTGYPDNLRDYEIPLAARIVAVCDVYDALRSRRVYKPALAHAAVVQLIRNGHGTHFDPALLECFEQCQEDFARIYEELKD